jgi:hypothetical protein
MMNLIGGTPRKLLALACVALIFTLPQMGNTSPVHLSPVATPIPASFFGIHLHRPATDTWPQIPFAEWRLWDSKGTIWYDLEPRKSEWNFSQLDQDVAVAEQHGIGLLLTLGQTPPWASSGPEGPPAWRPGGVAPPKDERDWIDYLRTVVTRYKGRIHEYEIWNEPNLKEFFTGSIEQLLTLAKDAYRVIHEIDPTAVVVSPSITGEQGVAWLDKYLTIGGGNYADVIGYHFYVASKAPEIAVETIQQIHSVLHKHSVDKPIWNTESGWLIHSDFEHPESGTSNVVLSPVEGLSYVMRAYLVNWASNVSRLYWYDWDGNPMGLGDNMGRQSKLAAFGYSTIEGWLVGATMRGCDRDRDGSWVCELDRDGHTERIIWNSNHTISKTIPSNWKINHVVTLSPTGIKQLSDIGGSAMVEYASIPSLLY